MVSISAFMVPVASGELAAFELGQADPDAPVVLAAHGITANSRSWLPVARELGDRARLVAADLRGRGASRELPGPYGMAAHAADLLAVLDHLEVPRAVLAGHSMGAYVVARLAIDHPERVSAVVLVDGGLPLPGAEGVDPQRFLDAFLGPSIARLGQRFASPADYLAFWRAHPAFGDGDVSDEDLAAFAEHDLAGQAPEYRSTVVEEAVRGDGVELLDAAPASDDLKTPATMLRAVRGLQNNPEPMVPPRSAAAWAAGAPDRRTAAEVPDTNHYTITLGAGAGAVAEAIADCAGGVAVTPGAPGS